MVTDNPATCSVVMPGLVPGHDGEAGGLASHRPDPVPVKAVRHAVAEMHQRERACRDISGIEHREVADIVAGAPDHGEDKAVAFRRLVVAGDEDRLGDGITSGKQIAAAAPAFAVDMDDA